MEQLTVVSVDDPRSAEMAVAISTCAPLRKNPSATMKAMLTPSAAAASWTTTRSVPERTIRSGVQSEDGCGRSSEKQCRGSRHKFPAVVAINHAQRISTGTVQ